MYSPSIYRPVANVHTQAADKKLKARKLKVKKLKAKKALKLTVKNTPFPQTACDDVAAKFTFAWCHI